MIINFYCFFLCENLDALDLKFSDESDELAEEGLCGPEHSNYRGPHIDFPLQKKDLDVIIDLFRKKKVSLCSSITLTHNDFSTWNKF